MRDIFDVLEETQSVTCVIDDDHRGPTGALEARIECLAQSDGVTRSLLSHEVGAIELVATGPREADAFVSARTQGGVLRELVGHLNERGEGGLEGQLALLELGRMAGISWDQEQPTLEGLRSRARERSISSLTPELAAVSEAVLWDDAWYSDPEAFAVDYEELGGDAGDAKALSHFADKRLGQDFEAFLDAADNLVADDVALLALETTPSHAGVIADEPTEGLAWYLLTGPVGRHMGGKGELRFLDRKGELVVEVTGASKERSFALRAAPTQLVELASRVCSGLEPGRTIAGVWEEARPLRLAEALLDLDDERAVIQERGAVARDGNEPLAAQAVHAQAVAAGTSHETPDASRAERPAERE